MSPEHISTRSTTRAGSSDRSGRRSAALRRLTAVGLAAALVVLAPWAVPGPASAGPRVSSPVTQVAERVVTPRLVARATLSADYLAPGPRSGALATPANGRTGPVQRPGHPRLLRRGRQRATAPSGRCPTTASAPRPTRPTSCCGSTWSGRAGSGRRRRGRDPDPALSSALPTRPQDRLPDRQRGHRRPAAHRRRLRHRVAAADARRHASGSARSSARSCCTSTARGRVLSAPVAVPARQVPAEPAARQRRRPHPGQRRLRGDGDVARTAATCTRSWRRRWSATPTPGVG